MISRDNHEKLVFISDGFRVAGLPILTQRLSLENCIWRYDKKHI